MANESERSKVILINPRAKTESYKRSDHADFATSSELKERKFDGWRQNKLMDVVELWVNGEVVRTVTTAELQRDAQACEKVYAEYFKLR